jgi:hypothetical protein
MDPDNNNTIIEEIECRAIRNQRIKERIELMTKHHQIEVLRLLNKEESVHKNENSNGTFINLSEQSDAIIKILEEYADYVDEQQKQFNKIEQDKDQLRKGFF